MDDIQILRSIDKMDRIGPKGVFDLLTDGRKDESGAWTPGCGMEPTKAAMMMEFFKQCSGCETNEETLFKMRRFFGVLQLNKEELDALIHAYKALGVITEEDEALVSDPVAIKEYYGTSTEKPVWR